ncbi:MAG: hypothetical protein R6U04_10600 [Bacteroidales bacterium]
MKLSYRVFITTLFLIYFLLTGYSRAQESGTLVIKGLVEEYKDDYGPLQDADVTILQNGEKFNTTRTKDDGLFDIEMEVNNEYIIEFSKDDYVTKKILVDANLPEDVEGTWTVEFSITLFEMYPGLDISALEDPVTKIVYFEREDGFDYDRMYTEKMMGKVDKIMDQLEKLKEEAYREIIREGDKNFDNEEYEKAIKYYKEALERRPKDRHPQKRLKAARDLLEEHKEKQTLYEKSIVRADNFFGEEEYKEAKIAYNEALNYDKNREYPREQIRIVDSIIAERNANEEEYNSLIRNADQAYSTEQFKEAREDYQAALDIKPDRKHPKKRIASIDDILEEQRQKEENYNDFIERADLNFESEEYEDAKESYRQALSVKSDETYPRDEINKIDKILAEREEQEKQEKEQERIQRMYEEEIEKADNYFAGNAYYDAREHYEEALQYKPEEDYPRKRLNKIEEILAEFEAAKQSNAEKENEKSKKPEEEEKDELQDFSDLDSKEEEREYLNELVEEYPEGVTVENYEFDRRSVKRVIVNYDDKATEYRKVKHSWGGTYYFRNGSSISQAVFNVETKERN